MSALVRLALGLAALIAGLFGWRKAGQQQAAAKVAAVAAETQADIAQAQAAAPSTVAAVQDRLQQGKF